MTLISYGKREKGLEPKPEKPKPKKREWMKILTVWAICIATVAVLGPLVLAAFDKICPYDTSPVFAGCITVIVTYAAKSFGEKSSRNKYGLDEDGKPRVKEEINNG